ncbi:FG-GAP-like repeat-containing protein [Kitasatospora sp. NPDC088391]|uniref:FG-GAP-like repeat-containing protein n=1 Tax=Kitasatospora sp. NPDC088391 TaxID=3364074 RepID=UPI00382081CB
MKRTAALAAAAIAAAGLLSATAPSAAAEPTTVAPAAAPLRVMPLGDSITAGYGSTDWNGYRKPLNTLLGAQSRYRADLVGSLSGGTFADPDNEGHSTYTIDRITQGIDGWLVGAQPDVVLLHLGINDLNNGIPAGAPDRLAGLVDRILADRPTATVLVQGLVPTTSGLEDAVRTFNTAVQAAVQTRRDAGRRVRYLTPPALTGADWFDPLHPADPGYAKLGQVFATGLDQAVADGTVLRPAARRAGTEAGGTGRVRFADWDGDGRADCLTVEDSGAVRVQLNRGGDGHGGWTDLGQVATGLTTDRSRVRFADFDGDGKADYLLLQPNGAVSVFRNDGGDGHGGWTDLGQVAAGAASSADQVRFADFDGDGRTDYLAVADDGSVSSYLNRGGDGHGGWAVQGRIATGTTTDRSRVRFADIDGDGLADYSTVAPDGSVSSYLNRGGDGHGGWAYRGRITSGQTTDQNAVQFTDFTGDGIADYLYGAFTGTGPVRAYANNGGDGTGGWLDLGRITGGF